MQTKCIPNYICSQYIIFIIYRDDFYICHDTLHLQHHKCNIIHYDRMRTNRHRQDSRRYA